MEINANIPQLDRDLGAKAFFDDLRDLSDLPSLEDAIAYYSFPIYKDLDDSSSRVHALVISPRVGVLAVECSNLSDGRSLRVLSEHLDQSTSQIVARLIRSPRLRRGPQALGIPLSQAIYLSGPSGGASDSTELPTHVTLCRGQGDLRALLTELDTEPLSEVRFRELAAILEGSTGILSPKQRKLRDETTRTRGRILRDIESDIANFDRDQKRAAMNIIDGPQRIRGLAGSGKTIILTWKAALIHLQDPQARIVYTYYTKSLHGLVKTLITRFYRHYAEHDPNWDNIRIMHAWGGVNLPGVYSTICSSLGMPPTTYTEASSISEHPFDFVCSQIDLDKVPTVFDYCIVDEGQDFRASFYRLCHSATTNGRIIWGYDECQNILEVEIQDPRQTFGVRDGRPVVDLATSPPGVHNDVVLHRCYRNPREVLINAFALGLGLYNAHILQMLENNAHWEDLGFAVLAGRSRVGDEMIIERPEQSSPLALSRQFASEAAIRTRVLDSVEAEIEWVTTNIVGDIALELLPEDVLVISLDDRYARRYFQALARGLRRKGIRTYDLLESPPNSTRFTSDGCVTLSTVYRAKGNEAGSVHVLGVDSVFVRKDAIGERNKLFTALTRTKGWLSISGSGPYAAEFEKEYLRVRQDYPLLKFQMPDRATLKTFQRDLSEQQEQLLAFERQLEQHARKMGVTTEELLKRMQETAARKRGK